MNEKQKKAVAKMIEKEKVAKPLNEEQLAVFRSEVLGNLSPELADKIQFEIDLGEGGFFNIKPAEDTAENWAFFSYLEDFIVEQQKKTGGLIFWNELGERLTDEDFSPSRLANFTPKKQIGALQNYITTKIVKVEFPIDSVNRDIWDYVEEDQNGQYKFRTSQTNPASLVYVGLKFGAFGTLDETVKFSKKLTEFDKMVYTFISSMFNAGNEVVTASGIYKEMSEGKKKKPNSTDLKKINDSLSKMIYTSIYISNNPELNTGANYPQQTYDGSLLPAERKSAYINGKLCNSAIHLFREPPLLTFAKERKHVTTVSPEVLRVPLSNTEVHIKLTFYLLERIARMKNPNTQTHNVILLQTIYEECKITGKQKQRLPPKLTSILDHFKNTQYIIDYKLTEDKIEITYKEKQRLPGFKDKK